MVALLPGGMAQCQERNIDFNADDFLAQVNSDLVGKFVNVAGQTQSFCQKQAGPSRRVTTWQVLICWICRAQLRAARVWQNFANRHADGVNASGDLFAARLFSRQEANQRWLPACKKLANFDRCFHSCELAWKPGDARRGDCG
jgi:methionyl-tRNA synthetase